VAEGVEGGNTMTVSHHGHRESFEEVVEGWHPAERAGCLTYILDNVPRTFRDDTDAKKYIYWTVQMGRGG
jgi:hypothetical protein